MSRPRSGYLFKRGHVWWLEYKVDGKRIRESTEATNKDEAEKYRDRILRPIAYTDREETLRTLVHHLDDEVRERETRADDVTAILVKDAWAAFMKSVNRPDTGVATLRQYASQFTCFVRWLDEHHKSCTKLRDVSRNIARSYAEHLVKENRSSNTYNKYCNLLSLVFRTLQNTDAQIVDHWAALPRRRIISDGRRAMTTEELKNVLNSAQGDLRLLLTIGLYTGLRLGDCATLRWREVDLKRMAITRIPLKTSRTSNKTVVVPIHPTLNRLLKAVPMAERKEYVLPGMAAKYLRQPTYVTDIVQAHFKTCGIETTKPKAEGRSRATVVVGFHSLRHSFVTLCRQGDVPLAVVESIVGHSNPAMTRLYTHVGVEAARTAVAALPSLMSRAKPQAKEPENVR